ncbi:MAG: ABC transporter ATP-binding protein [Asgard group archaeon]|nr:ABC transporter ATP-binding protein [Asgard group archaeon]
MTYIKIKNISFGYSKNNQLFSNLTLNLDLGDYVAIIGRNGAGKTTLVKLIVGMLKPLEGQIKIAGEDIESKSVADIASQVGYVFQNPNQMLFANTVEKELELSLRKFNFEKNMQSDKITEMLEFFDMVPLRDTNPRTLSRGEKQKLAIATVLIQDPKAIFLDEPFSGIDMSQRLMILDYLTKLHLKGKLIVIITHTLDLIVNNCNKIIGFKEGKILYNQEITDFLANPNYLFDLGLEQTNYLALLFTLRKHGLPSSIIKQNELVEYFKQKSH